jgi:hypothetical protein
VTLLVLVRLAEARWENFGQCWNRQDWLLAWTIGRLQATCKHLNFSLAARSIIARLRLFSCARSSGLQARHLRKARSSAAAFSPSGDLLSSLQSMRPNGKSAVRPHWRCGKKGGLTVQQAAMNGLSSEAREMFLVSGKGSNSAFLFSQKSFGMKRGGGLPLFAFTLLLISMLSACRHQVRMRNSFSPQLARLLYVFNGPLAFVWSQRDPSRIVVIVPADADHQLHFPDLNTIQTGTTNSFAMSPDGLQVPAALSGVDQLQDSYAKTDLWHQEKYFLTITLPLPTRIMPVTPATQVTFKDPATGKETQGLMFNSILLEYLVLDPSKVKVTSSGLKNAHSVSVSELQREYKSICQLERTMQFSSSCTAVQKLIAQYPGSNTNVFFFGVGLPLDTSMPEDQQQHHAITFFNDVLISRSFPNLKMRHVVEVRHTTSLAYHFPRARLVSATLESPVMHSGLLPVSAVIDCKAVAIFVEVSSTK